MRRISLSAQAAILTVFIATLLRLLFAAGTGLGIDESYTVAAASHFSWSYFDHPPISWWLELASRRIFSSEIPIVVRLPFVILSVVSSWLLYCLSERLYGGRAGFWAVLAFNLSPVFSLAFGNWVLPDGPLDTFLLAAAYALSRALGIGTGIGQEKPAPEPAWWFGAGLAAGFALLSKYNAVLTLAGALLLLLTDPVARAHLRSWRPWAAGIIAVILFLPVIYWNHAHGWASFHYQSGRATGLRLHPAAPLTIWGGEALFVLPWIWLPMVALLVAALRRGPSERRGWMLAMLGIIPIILFALIGIWSSTRILYHWAAPGYLMLFPLLGDWASRWRPHLRNAVATATALLLAGASLGIIAQISYGAIGNFNSLFPPGKSPLLQAVDWESAAAQIPNTPGLAVATLRWYDAGKIGYALQGRLPVTVFGPEPHQFGISTPPASLLGHDILILAMPGDVSAITKQFATDFQSISSGPGLAVVDHGAMLLFIPTLLGHHLLKAPQ